jgi:hypothetical protein
MADRVLFVSWGQVVRGREERALEVFTESLGFYGRLQQEGRIAGFDVVLLEPSSGLGGYIAIQGSAEQIAALSEDQEFRRLILDSTLIVDDVRVVPGRTNEALGNEIAMYQEAIAKVPQSA